MAPLAAHPRLHRFAVFLAPAAVFLTIREIGMLVLHWMAGRDHSTADVARTAWDGQWYLAIAGGGYSGVPHGLVDAFGHRNADTPMAFFPGYPYLVRWTSELLPAVDVLAAAFLVSFVAGLSCAYALNRLGTLLGGSRRVGLCLVGLFAASPMAIVLSMTYSEGLFCALAAWALVGVVRRSWLLAGLCTAAAGLVRPTAGALIITVAVAAAVTILRREQGWRACIGLLFAPFGLIGYLAWVGLRTGRWDGWFALQERGWASHFDGGAATVRFTLDTLAGARSVLEVGTVGIIGVALVLLVIGVRRVPWQLTVYAVGVLAMDLGSNGLMNSKARLLLPAFTLLLPAAIGLARRRPATAITVIACLAVVGGWFGAYSITAWPYAI